MPAYAGPTPADPFGSGHVFDIFDVMEQAELNAAPVARTTSGRRAAPAGRSRWQPPHWAVAAQPPMLAGEPAVSDRPDRGPPVETWALPSRPFMLRRDRHAPRWSQSRGTPPSAPVARLPVEPVDAVPSRGRPVPIEAGPPPVPEPPQSPEPELTAPEAIESAVSVREPETVRPEEAQSELPWSVTSEPEPVLEPSEAEADEPEPPPVPANDVVSGPVVQPIVIGAESAPLERKRGWWRRR
jgi:hypothetical protein